MPISMLGAKGIWSQGIKANQAGDTKLYINTLNNERTITLDFFSKGKTQLNVVTKCFLQESRLPEAGFRQNRGSGRALPSDETKKAGIYILTYPYTPI